MFLYFSGFIARKNFAFNLTAVKELIEESDNTWGIGEVRRPCQIGGAGILGKRDCSRRRT